MTPDTSSVLPGLITANGWSSGNEGYELHSLPECDFSSSACVEIFSSPTTALKSAHAACNVAGAVSCCGGMAWESGTVDAVDGKPVEPRWPAYHPPTTPTVRTGIASTLFLLYSRIRMLLPKGTSHAGVPRARFCASRACAYRACCSRSLSTRSLVLWYNWPLKLSLSAFSSVAYDRRLKTALLVNTRRSASSRHRLRSSPRCMRVGDMMERRREYG